jgi:hypothetical protein
MNRVDEANAANVKRVWLQMFRGLRYPAVWMGCPDRKAPGGSVRQVGAKLEARPNNAQPNNAWPNNVRLAEYRSGQCPARLLRDGDVTRAGAGFSKRNIPA